VGKFYRLHGAAAGSPGQLQFNSFGVMGADPSLSFDPATKVLSLSGIPATTDVPMEVSGQNGTVRISLSDSHDVLGLEIISADDGGGNYHDIGITGLRGADRLFRLEAWDSTARLQLWWATGGVQTNEVMAYSSQGAIGITGSSANGAKLRIEHTGADLLLRSTENVGLWSDLQSIKVGPPTGEIGTPGGLGDGHSIAFRAFDSFGGSTNMGELKCAWSDAGATTFRFLLEGGEGALIDPGLLLKSPDGSIFRLVVDDVGILSTVAL
jgi:hypothetical protein